MAESPVQKSVYLSPDAYTKLTFLADVDARKFSGEVNWLIDNELRRRGLDPETLQPVSSPEPGPTASRGLD